MLTDRQSHLPGDLIPIAKANYFTESWMNFGSPTAI